DPDPDTPENEYKQKYYERIQFANEHYSSGMPGWKTDRGRIYIIHGKPDEIDAHPAGGAYDRPSYEGGGTTTTYPFEEWGYRNIDGVGTDISIEFVDHSGSGEYRIARNYDEKDALLYIPNAGQTLLEQLGLDTKANRVAMAGGFGDGGRNRGLFGKAANQEFEKLEQITNLNRPEAVKVGGLEVRAAITGIANDGLPFSICTHFTRMSDESVVTMFAIELDHRELAFKNQGGVYSAIVNLYARLTGLSDHFPRMFEDTLQTARYTEERMPVAQTQRSLYQKNVVLRPGRYKIDVVARDVNSGKA